MFEENLKQLELDIQNCTNPPFETIIIEIKEEDKE